MVFYIILLLLTASVYIFVRGFPTSSSPDHDHDPSHHNGWNGGGNWDHVDQHKWPGICLTGHHQSPIDIQTSRVTRAEDEHLHPIRVIETEARYPRMYLDNNGHSVTFHLDKDVRLFGGEFSAGHYQVQQLHFHWGSENHRGSEHTIDGRHYAMEMHMVAYDTKEFSSFNHALGQKGGIAVVSTLFLVAGGDNSQMVPLVDAIQNVRTANDGTKIRVHDFDLHALLPANTRSFFSYRGSLTTPMCNENVDWTIFYEHVYVSQYQIDQFRKLRARDGYLLADNNRHVQNLNGRMIYKN